jgi:exonuclease VII large subunit
MMRCFRDVLTKVRGVEENFLYNFERFSNGLAAQKIQVAGSERILHREAERAYARLESYLASIEERYRNSGMRFDRYLRSLGADISGLDMHIRRNGRRWYTALGRKVTDCEAVLAANDPRLKLKQGFSIIKDRSGRVVRSRKMVAISDIIQVELYDGVLDAKVENIQ